jgi:NADPH:quinone reductase-like Zn-dependent oxidoreductase
MIAAPINPADFNFIEGVYGLRPEFPQVAGLEGVGRIERVGVAVPGLYRPGTLVIAPGQPGRWSGRLVLPAEELVLVPPGVEITQAAMASVNPATAYRLLKDFVNLVPGEWVAQNAASSGVARAVIQLARHRRLRTLNLVRRPEAVAPLLEAGATAVIDTSAAGWLEQARTALGEAPLKLAFNAVGGRAGADLAKLLAEGGTLVTYGGMAKEPFTLSTGALIFRDLQAHGFWITRWLRRANAGERQRLYTELFQLQREGVLRLPVEATYPLPAWREALAHAARPGRTGKVLFDLESI